MKSSEAAQLASGSVLSSIPLRRLCGPLLPRVHVKMCCPVIVQLTVVLPTFPVSPVLVLTPSTK